MANQLLDIELQQELQSLTEEQKISVLQLLKTFKQEEEVLSAKEVDDYNNEIAEAEAEIQAGEFYTQEEVNQRLKKWHLK